MSVVLTGSTGTLASLYAKQVAAKDPTAHLVLFVRQVNKVPAGVLPPRSAHVEYRSLDLTDLGAVRAAAKQLAEDVKTGKVPPIKALVLSAAIQHAGAEQPYFTADGYEETMAVNHLAHYALIRELIRSLDPKAARVIIVGSATHSSTYAYFTRKADLKPLDELLHPTPGCDPPAESLEYGQQRYGTSKLAQIMTGHELARCIGTSHPQVTVTLANPGTMGGTLFRTYPAAQRRIMNFMLSFTAFWNWWDPKMEVSKPANSAKMLVGLTLDPAYATPGKKPIGKLSEVGGACYYDPWGKEMETEGFALDVQDCRKLWAETAAALGYPEEI